MTSIALQTPNGRHRNDERPPRLDDPHIELDALVLTETNSSGPDLVTGPAHGYNIHPPTYRQLPQHPADPAQHGPHRGTQISAHAPGVTRHLEPSEAGQHNTITCCIVNQHGDLETGKAFDMCMPEWDQQGIRKWVSWIFKPLFTWITIGSVVVVPTVVSSRPFWDYVKHTQVVVTSTIDPTATTWSRVTTSTATTTAGALVPHPTPETETAIQTMTETVLASLTRTLNTIHPEIVNDIMTDAVITAVVATQTSVIRVEAPATDSPPGSVHMPFVGHTDVGGPPRPDTVVTHVGVNPFAPPPYEPILRHRR